MKSTSFLFAKVLFSNAVSCSQFRPVAVGILLLSAIAFATNANAQDRFGLLAGQNISSFRLDPDQGTKVTESGGFTAGFFYEKGFYDSPAGIHFSTMYIKKGGIAQDAYYGSIDIKLDYIEQQVLLKVGRGLFVEGGFSLGALLSARGKVFGQNEDIRESFSGMDFGFVAGAGFRIGIINIEARYSGSLISALNEDFEGQIFNNGIQLLAGFSIPMN
ncbi:MAG: hypothetical protein ACKVU2_00010 [Saprospiraceae bacterium]